MSDLWREVERQLSKVTISYLAGEAMTPREMTVRVMQGTSARNVMDRLTVGRPPWVYLTCLGRTGQSSHETGERVRIRPAGDDFILEVSQPSQIAGEARVERWTLECGECGRVVWRNPMDLLHVVVRGLAEWDARERPGRCRVAWSIS